MPHAFLLHLTPTTRTIHHKYLHQYSHGMFYHLLKTIDPELSDTVHAAEHNPVTLWAKQQRDKSVLLRVTILDDDLFQPFLSVVLQESLTGLELGQDRYQVARVLATPEGHKGAGYTTWQDIHSAQPTDRLELRFLSPTVFATSISSKRLYTPLPLPRLLLKSLLARYQQFAPQPFDSGQHAQLLASFEPYVAVTSHDIKTHNHQAGKVTLTGFVGKVNLRYIDHAPELRCALGRLGEFAFYSGVGAKTPYGMGQVRVVRQSSYPKTANSLSQTAAGGD